MRSASARYHRSTRTCRAGEAALHIYPSRVLGIASFRRSRNTLGGCHPTNPVLRGPPPASQGHRPAGGSRPARCHRLDKPDYAVGQQPSARVCIRHVTCRRRRAVLGHVRCAASFSRCRCAGTVADAYGRAGRALPWHFPDDRVRVRSHRLLAGPSVRAPHRRSDRRDRSAASQRRGRRRCGASGGLKQGHARRSRLMPANRRGDPAAFGCAFSADALQASARS